MANRKPDLKKLTNAALLDKFVGARAKNVHAELMRRLENAPPPEGQEFAIRLKLITECEDVVTPSVVADWLDETFRHSDMGRVEVVDVKEVK